MTRAREQASELVERLRRAGAETIEVPAIVVGPAADDGVALRDAASRVRGFDWVAFTSTNGVERFCAELPDARAFGDVRVAAIRSLGKYSQYESTETLLHLFKTEKDVAVRDRAYESLQVATGKHLPADPKAWENLLHQSGQPSAAPQGALAEDPAKKRNVQAWR